MFNPLSERLVAQSSSHITLTITYIIFDSFGHQLLFPHLPFSYFNVLIHRDLGTFDVSVFFLSYLYILPVPVWTSWPSTLPLLSVFVLLTFRHTSQQSLNHSGIQTVVSALLHRVLRVPRKYMHWWPRDPRPSLELLLSPGCSIFTLHCNNLRPSPLS